MRQNHLKARRLSIFTTFLGTAKIQEGKISQTHQSASLQHTDSNFGQSFKDFPAALKVQCTHTHTYTHTRTPHTNTYVYIYQYQYQFSCSVVSNSLQPNEPQHARPPSPSPNPGVHPNPCLSSRWCHPAISSSVVPFSSCPQSFPASGSFQMSQFFASGGQSTIVSASALVLPMNTEDWSPLGWTDWISLQSKGLSRIFSNTTVQKHQFFGAQLSL